jgi:phosphohistidine phosphatase SixA
MRKKSEAIDRKFAAREGKLAIQSDAYVRGLHWLSMYQPVDAAMLKSPASPRSRRLFALTFLSAYCTMSNLAHAQSVTVAKGAASVPSADAWQPVKPGTVVLFRHAFAPGVGDPPEFQMNNCATQRNLNEEGREQARRIGAAFRARQIQVGAVWTSQWCQTRETADLAFPNQRADQPAFNSFFSDTEAEPTKTRAAKALLNQWRGPGVAVVVTHQVNITAITGLGTASGEGIVVKPSAQGLVVLGRIAPPN